MRTLDTAKGIDALNAILEIELAGVVRYMHYSFMIYGHSRIPIVKWMREQADESLLHAAEAGEFVTALGGHPSLGIGKLLETRHHDVDHILQEALEHESQGLVRYRELLEVARDASISLEEYARKMIASEEMHVAEVQKMLRRPA